MSSHTDLEKTVAQEIAHGEFQGSFSIQPTHQTIPFAAHIKLPQLRDIHISYDPRFAQENPQQTQTIVKDITAHEINHKGYKGFVGCPQTVDNHAELFIEPMIEVLPGYSPATVHDLANALQDSILHCDLHKTRNLAGISDFFTIIGKKQAEHIFSPFYQAHVMINMYLWGTSAQKKQLSAHYTPDTTTAKKIGEAVKTFIETSGIAQSYIKGFRDPKTIREYVTEPQNWKKIATEYAKALSPLIPKEQSSSLFDDLSNDSSGRPQATPKSSQGRNQFDEEMQSNDYKRKRVKQALERNESMPNWLSQFEALDTLYSSLAKQLQLKVESYTHGHQFPVSWYRQKDFEPTIDKPKHLTMGIRSDGTVGLKRKTLFESHPVPVKSSPKGIPQIRYCLLDSSGSMLEPVDDSQVSRPSKCIPWGETSKYHHALLGWYGILAYLDAHHLGGNAHVGLAQFSENTTVAQGLIEAKKLALNPTFGNNTLLDTTIFSSFLKGENNLLFSISDGEISNWGTVFPYIVEHSKRNHYFHIQIGDKTKSCLDLEKKGIPFVVVRNARDLAQTVVDLTHKTYKGA
jgi:hypothetical protein